jgi:hypothetical protein
MNTLFLNPLAFILLLLGAGMIIDAVLYKGDKRWTGGKR